MYLCLSSPRKFTLKQASKFGQKTKQNTPIKMGKDRWKLGPDYQ